MTQEWASEPPTATGGGSATGTTTWPPPRELRVSQCIGGGSAGNGVPHRSLNLSNRPSCASSNVHTGTLSGVGMGGGIRARCMLLSSKPKRAHCALRASVAAASSESPPSSPALVVASVLPPGRLSTSTPLVCKYSTSPLLSNEPLIRMLRKRSAMVRGGNGASAALATSGRIGN